MSVTPRSLQETHHLLHASQALGGRPPQVLGDRGRVDTRVHQTKHPDIPGRRILRVGVRWYGLWRLDVHGQSLAEAVPGGKTDVTATPVP
jgi:hypothetical protein